MKLKKGDSSMNQVNQTTRFRKLSLAQKQKNGVQNFYKTLRVYGLLELGCVYLPFALQKN